MEIKKEFSPKAKYDAKLVAQAQNGDQSAFAELMGKYWNPIYFMIDKMIADEQDVEDLTIETFGRAFKNIDSYLPAYAFSTWLFRIASNNCIDFMRKKARQNNMVNIDDHLNSENDNETTKTLNIKCNNPTPEDLIITKQKKANLHKLIKKLTPQYRKIIELRYFKELSYAEISEELQIKVELVKVQIFRSKALLTKMVKEAKEL